MKRNTIIYTLPGLGTDSRIYSRLDLPVIFRHLEWLEPEPDESLTSYCRRMCDLIPDKVPVILMGVSFGGMVAQQIAALRPVKKILLISSVRAPSELPWNLVLMKYIPLYYLSKGSWRIRTLPLWSPAFGITKPSEQELLKEMFGRFSDTYRMWAIRQVVMWKENKLEVPISRFHGSIDKVFPSEISVNLTNWKGEHIL